jgi:hypothetical protein
MIILRKVPGDFGFMAIGGENKGYYFLSNIPWRKHRLRFHIRFHLKYCCMNTVPVTVVSTGGRSGLADVSAEAKTEKGGETSIRDIYGATTTPCEIFC